jgi:acyl-CoA reductase-like NAD-dependent aldehyde dehydrogenase
MPTRFDIISPVDGTARQTGRYFSDAEAFERVSHAEDAQRDLARMSPEERAQLCLSFLDAFEDSADQSAEEVTIAMGKPLAQAKNEIRGMRDRTEALCRWVDEALADIVLEEKPGLHRRIRREPVGVVLDIAAWNYPFLVAINVIAPAVLAGNAVLLKHAPQTALVGRQMQAAFNAAGGRIASSCTRATNSL